jgi:hypothetical protein
MLLYTNRGALRGISMFNWCFSEVEVVASIMKILLSNEMKVVEFGSQAFINM